MQTFNRLCFSILLSLSICTSAVALTEDAWYSQADMRRLYEALTVVQTHHLSPENQSRSIDKAIQSYTKALDPYSDYLTKDEYDALKSLSSSSYGGLGFWIRIDDDGRVLCDVKDGSRIALAGLRQDDELISVDGDILTGQSIYLSAAKLRGPVGSTAKLIVRSEGELERTLQVPRFPTIISSVEVLDDQLVKISEFTSRTADQLARILRSASGMLVLDLRGNYGGELQSAIDSAELFLDADQTILTKKNTKQTEVIKASFKKLASEDLHIWILQDHLTASAAEVFIAAITQNAYVDSVGETTYGKCRSQELFELSDGSALKLTTSRLIPPSGRSCHVVGLSPTTDTYPSFITNLLEDNK